MRPTNEELSKLYFLKKLIDQDTERLHELEDRLQARAHIMTGMPRTKGVKDLIGDLTPLIVDARQTIAEEWKDYLEEEIKLKKFINGINDYQLRLIFLLRFVDLKTWDQVADAVGGGSTNDSVRQACYRFLHKRKKSNNQRGRCEIDGNSK